MSNKTKTTKTLGLRVGGIIVKLDETGKNGSIDSYLHYDTLDEIEGIFEDNDEWQRYESAIDGLESLILAHGCSGVDILSKEYIKGVTTAIEAISNNA